jgi:tether containing UBX domain for GLUT4
MAMDEPSAELQSRDILAPVNVFSAPTGPVPAATLREEDETVYEPTIAHAKLHQARLQASSLNRRLKSDEELAAEMEAETARLAAVTSLRVKVRFPDQSSSVWNLPATATGATIYAAVRGVMAHPDQKFKLVLPGRQVVADSEGKEKDLLVKGYRLRGSVLLNLTWDDSVSDEARKGPFLRSQVAEKAEPILIPDAPAVEEEDEPEEKQPAPAPPKPSGSGSGKSGGGVPKWFKGLGGKK